jgi:hypothetical protein
MDKLVLTGITHPGTFELTDGLTSLGRNPTNDYRIHDATVSSFHCEFVICGNSILVRDLNSTNGTFIDGQPIQESILKPGQILRLGTAELRVDLEEEQEPVRIAIPEIKSETQPVQTHLLDGSLACLLHPGVAAVVKCTKCEQAFCGDCVRSLRVQGGQTRLFCPNCSAACEPLAPATTPKKKPSFFGRLTQTIRIRWK